MALPVIIIVSALIIGFSVIGGLIYKKSTIDKRILELSSIENQIEIAKSEAKNIVSKAKKDALAERKEQELKGKEIAYKLKEEAEKEIKEQKSEITAKEERLNKREENLDTKFDKLEEKGNELENKEKEVEKKKQEIEDIKQKQEEELIRIARMNKEEAKERLLNSLKDSLTNESATLIREFKVKLEEEKERRSKRILSTAIGKSAADYVVDTTVSVVQLPSDDMKGRIIGREGRNIRTIEALTGVDIIIDDTPEAVVLSSFDGVRRAIAKNAIEKLVLDGRIHPAKIEEIVNKAKKEVNEEIIEAGEQALFEVGIPNIHQEIVKILGALKFRSSFGQNVLTHSIEVAHAAGTMAAEIKGNVKLAKRAGLLHDVGKVLDNDGDGSHAIIGAEFLKKYGEQPEVLNAVAAHHGEVEYKTVEAILVQAADAVSASRPGARRETLSTYLKRLEELEGIANSFEGVENSYAIQAGREVRLIINPEIVDDNKALIMSRDVAKKIEETMQYPGQIKVTVVRETRAVDYAK